MLLRALFFVVLLAAFAGRAEACRYQSQPIEANLARAQQAFIGTVRTVENGLTILTVEQAIRGVKEGDTVEAEYGGSSCDIRFTAGQRWFYLGSGHPSGSLLLQDENGNEIPENIEAVTTAMGAPVAGRGGMVIGGTLERSCAPWDGAAYMITLDNGITAHVYDSIAQRDNTSTAVYQADGKPERGHGQILDCANNKACQPLTGTITMGAVDFEAARGRIDIKDGEHNIRHVFKVKRVHKQVFCG
jgi:hypothetical protein